MYEGLLRLHILPELGDVQLGRLDVALIRSWAGGQAAHHQRRHRGEGLPGAPSDLTTAVAEAVGLTCADAGGAGEGVMVQDMCKG